MVYTHPDCAYSSAVKYDYNNRGIIFEEVDISVHPGRIHDLERLTGGERITPVIVEGDKISIGFQGLG